MTAPKPAANVLEMIGDTPMLEVSRLDAGPCRLFLKLENQNPGGSIKDRIGLSMVEAAEAEGRIKPGGTIVEATAGNTGLGLALAAAQKGYRMLVVVPDKMSQEKVFHLRALGAEVRMTRSDVGKGHPEYYQDVAERLAKELPNAFWANQFANPANPRAHETGTGPEIWQQMEGRLDAVVCGVGSGGTITGLARYLKSVNPSIEIVLADPKGSVLAPLVNEGRQVEVGAWMVEGIGEDFVPPNCELGLVTRAYEVSDAESFATARELLAREGVLAGSSTGTLLDFWMADQGFLKRERYGDLRDLISRRAVDRQVVSAAPSDTLLNAYGRMRLYDVSQLPVLDGLRIVGIIDESDILLAVYNHAERFAAPVSEFMTSRLEIVPPSAGLEELMPIFRADRVAIVVGEDGFQGLITKVDVINHLRQKVS
jgi:cystathionine beta-synthase